MSNSGDHGARAPGVANTGAERTGSVVRLGRMLPGGARRFLGSAYGRRALRSLDRWGERVSRDDAPVVVGPFVSEVGFEILYWIPFLRWVLDRYDISQQRIVAISRGGADLWYEGVCSRYRDVFELLSPEEFTVRNRARARRNRGQKAMRITPEDLEIVAGLVEEHEAAHLLHPAMMFRLFRPWFWGFLDMSWVLSRTRFAPLVDVAPPQSAALPAGGYVAAKFYANKAFPATPDNAARARSIIRRVEEHLPVVQLETGLRLDEHEEFGLSDPDGRQLMGGSVEARSNLLEQTRVLAGATAFVGTYGGFSYLAPFCGVPAFALFSEADGFHASHLRLAEAVTGKNGLADLLVSGADRGQAIALADALIARARPALAASRGSR